MARNVSVLFVRRDSIYKTMVVKDTIIDCWDIDRDAKKWPGGGPIVAHPPCRAWGQLSHFAKPRPDEKNLAIWSIEQIRKWGGVLEHPRASKLWPYMNLPMPGKYDEFGGYSICVDQSWFGHKAKKNTLLYICGCPLNSLPPLPMNFNAIEYAVETTKKSKQQSGIKAISKKEREATPEDLARFLIEVANRCFVVSK